MNAPEGGGMNTGNEATASQSTRSDVLRWILTSGIATAALALWATLLGLLYRTAWLSAFGIPEDLFFPSSATELTYWGYVALLELWFVVQRDYFGALLLMGAFTVASVCLGMALAFAWVKYRPKAPSPFDHRSVKLSFEAAKILGLSAVYPVATFYLATALLLLPFPAYERGKDSAQRRIHQYEIESAAATRSCHTLDGPQGAIGTCPLVIAQTTERIAFLDGKHVHVIPAEGIRIQWSLPVRAPTVTGNSH